MPFTRLLFCTTATFVLFAVPALAQDDPFNPDVYDASLKAITILLVIAVLLESALEVVFNWRVFRAYFSVSGVKTLINFAVSFMIVVGFDVDIMSTLLEIYTEPDENSVSPDSNLGTQALTALVIAGGSSGVNNLLEAFGYRNGSSNRDDTPKPPPDTAWIAVRVRRKQARSAVQVHVSEDPRPPAGLTSIAGTCLAGRPGLLSLLMRNNDRFPSNGGYAVKPDTAFRISVSATGADGKPVSRDVTETPVKLAAGAAVDFEVEL